MFDAVMEWVRGLFGDAADEMAQGVTDSAEEAVGGAGETMQDVQDTAETVTGAVEDPEAAVTDFAQDQLGNDN
ncbi:hypothetical protein J4H86_20815 [Spiractinospora alimapuensis]|uniref:hypothetical protein n=1 Tax=Spiractinospora alimapuensis TaxID=2820884 RepID=UPI001F27417D|nr:hypothetical protein [Spiractinospora alimapuensis]QVQ51240.1 hypothetical protein J4H86_20815 [Spiractinospora alimapuensis]